MLEKKQRKNIYLYLKSPVQESIEMHESIKLKQIKIEQPSTDKITQLNFKSTTVHLEKTILDLFLYGSKEKIKNHIRTQSKLKTNVAFFALQRDGETIDRSMFVEILKKLSPSENELSVITADAIKFNRSEALYGIAQWSGCPLKVITFDLGQLCEDPIEYAHSIGPDSELIDIIKTINAEFSEQNSSWFQLPCIIL